MPDQQTLERAHEDAREGKSPSTQAGEFVREEMHHIREGQHGARSTKQAIAIGLSKARRAGVKLGLPRRGVASATTVQQAKRDFCKGQSHARRRNNVARQRGAVQPGRPSERKKGKVAPRQRRKPFARDLPTRGLPEIGGVSQRARFRPWRKRARSRPYVKQRR